MPSRPAETIFMNRVFDENRLSVVAAAESTWAGVVSVAEAPGPQDIQGKFLTHKSMREVKSWKAPASMVEMPLSKSNLFSPFKTANGGTGIDMYRVRIPPR